MVDILLPALWAGGLFAALLSVVELGRWLGRRRIAQDPHAASMGRTVVDGAIFGLFGLLVAFTFSGAVARFDARRAMIGQEANDIGTAYLRIDLLLSDAQPALRALFRDYLDARIAAYGKLPDIAEADAELARSTRIQGEIWKLAVAAMAAKGDPATTEIVAPALNEMIDITATRTMSGHLHPPFVIFAMLCGLAMFCALLVGYSMAGDRLRNWVYVVSFAGIVSLTVYVIIDIEFPRFGLIRETELERVLVDLRDHVN